VQTVAVLVEDVGALYAFVAVDPEDTPAHGFGIGAVRFLDGDGKDVQSVHVMGYEKKQLVAYARLVPPGVSYKTPSIGRVVVHAAHRGKKYAYTLMEECIKETLRRYKTNTITISAQLYLRNFYTRTGFNAVGDVYPEDNIPHIKMIYSKK